MPGHAARDRMNSVFHGDAAIFQNTGQFTHGVLCLGRGQAVARHKYDFVGVSQLHCDVIETYFAHHALLAFAYRSRRRAAESAEQNVRNRTIHRAAHENRKNESGESVERARDDQHVIPQHKTRRRRCQARVRIQ